MAIVEHHGEKVFEYRFRPIKIIDTDEKNFDVLASATMSDIGNDDFSYLYAHKKLRVALKLLEGDSRSQALEEYRASHVSAGSESGSFRARFSIPREMFDDQQCRLAQLDLVYEGKFWFDDILKNPTLVPIWIEKRAREVDVFEYYRTKYLKKEIK